MCHQQRQRRPSGGPVLRQREGHPQGRPGKGGDLLVAADVVPGHGCLLRRLGAGTQVDPEILASIPSGFALRLLRLDPHLWERALNPPLQAPENLQQPEAQSLWDHDRYADLLAPEPQGEKHQDRSLDDYAQTIRYKGRSIPVFTGTGPLGQTMAILEMLAAYYNIPFRRDVLERAAKHGVANRSVSLQQLGDLSTILGFTGSLATLPETQFSRLPFPCFAIVEGQPAMIHDVTRDTVKAVLPEYGRVNLSVSDLTQGRGGAEILILNPGRDSQQRKLGLSWFFPQIFGRNSVFKLNAPLYL